MEAVVGPAGRLVIGDMSLPPAEGILLLGLLASFFVVGACGGLGGCLCAVISITARLPPRFLLAHRRTPSMRALGGVARAEVSYSVCVCDERSNTSRSHV